MGTWDFGDVNLEVELPNSCLLVFVIVLHSYIVRFFLAFVLLGTPGYSNLSKHVIAKLRSVNKHCL